MKNYLLILILCSIARGTFCQQWTNLVPNYSFEKVKAGYPTSADYLCKPNYSNTVDYWNQIYNWTHLIKHGFLCDLFHQPGVGTANVLPNGVVGDARSGTKRGNGAPGEFLTVKLKNGGMKSGKSYYVEVFHNGSSYSDVYFSNGQPRQCNGKDIKSPKNGILSKVESTLEGNDWTRTRFYFKSFLNFDWLTLGTNGNSGDGHGGGDWDDIRIYEVQPNKCRTDWYFDNTVFNYPTEVFQASHNIYIGKGVDPENGSNHIPGKVVQYGNSNIIISPKSSIQKLRI